MVQILFSNSFGVQYIFIHSPFFKIGLSLGHSTHKEFCINEYIKNNKKILLI